MTQEKCPYNNAQTEKKEEERKRMGQRIDELMRENGLTQTELSRRTGIGQGHVSRIISGQYDVRLSILSTIAKALHCRIDFVKE